jgi:hypothetical protein
MSIRTTVNSGAWVQVGTGPATVQVISPDAGDVSVMVFAGAAQPSTNSDGLVLNSENQIHNFNITQPIWAQVVENGLSATVACQPETT